MRRNVIDQNSARCTSVVRAGDGAEAFSTCSVPKLRNVRKAAAIYGARKVEPEALCASFARQFRL
jgi:hypothetical protein